VAIMGHEADVNWWPSITIRDLRCSRQRRLTRWHAVRTQQTTI